MCACVCVGACVCASPVPGLPASCMCVQPLRQVKLHASPQVTNPKSACVASRVSGLTTLHPTPYTLHPKSACVASPGVRLACIIRSTHLRCSPAPLPGLHGSATKCALQLWACNVVFQVPAHLHGAGRGSLPPLSHPFAQHGKDAFWRARLKRR